MISVNIAFLALRGDGAHLPSPPTQPIDRPCLSVPPPPPKIFFCPDETLHATVTCMWTRTCIHSSGLFGEAALTKYATSI